MLPRATSGVGLFAVSLFASALLLFLVQPMFARMVLPLLGGSPAVWTTCMLFFQAGLLAGYGYVHATTKWLTLRAQVVLQLALVTGAMLMLPFEIPAPAPEQVSARPTVWLLGALTTSVGLPFFVLSTSAPLLQRWFAARGHSRDPYFLYAASNAGSLTALLLYPVIVEPLLGLAAQRRTWALGFGVTALLVISCAVAVWNSGTRHAADKSTDVDATHVEPDWGTRLRWLVLSFVPSGLMLAVTMYISTDVAVVPMFWIVPLALYLVTFIVAFGGAAEWIVPPAKRLFPLVLLPLVMLLMVTAGGPLAFVLPLHLVTFLVFALLCHAELAQSRPAVRYLTEFYLWISVGGVLGGVFNGIVAPAVFTGPAEYPLLIAAGCIALASGREWVETLRRPRSLLRPVTAAAFALLLLIMAGRLELQIQPTLALLGVSLLLCFSVSRRPAAFAVGIALLLAVGTFHKSRAWGDVLEAHRTFFGIYRVVEESERPLVTLYHGTTVHGRQASGELAPEPLTYYHRQSPIGQVLSNRAPGTPLAVGVVGLGIGSLAAYAERSDRWTFYEIDPAVERLARDTRYFQYLQRCGDVCEVRIGDARLSIGSKAGSDPLHDILVIDAFSSDAIPMHLLTREAVARYLAHLGDEGLLAFHISNRHVELSPALARVARDLNLVAAERRDAIAAEHPLGYTSSEWLLMSRSAAALERATAGPEWTTIVADTASAWTDDFSNIWTAMKWR